MKRLPAILAIFAASATLSGCNAFNQLVAGNARQSFTVSDTVSDFTAKADVQSVVVLNENLLTNGDTLAGSPVSLASLAPVIEAGREGLGGVQFFIRAQFSNQDASQAVAGVFAAAQGPTASAPRLIGTVTLGPSATSTPIFPGQMNQSAAAVDGNLKAIFAQMDGQYSLIPGLAVEGGGPNGVDVAGVEIAAAPVYIQTTPVAPAGVPGYANVVEDVAGGTIGGEATNNGVGLAQVDIYLANQPPFQPATDLIAHGVLAPGETATGAQLMTPIAADRIRQTVYALIDGAQPLYEFVVASEQPVNVTFTHLVVTATVVATAKVF